MAITTYAELKASIADFLNRDDLTSVATDFITLAEADINRRVRHWRLEGRATAQVDTQFSALPADFAEALTFHVTSGDLAQIELLSKAEMLKRRKSSSDATGKPAFYAITAGEIEVYPTPDGTYSTELYYYKRVAALSDSNTTNDILTYFPDVYLYGALVHSAPYLKDDARVAVWGNTYAQTLADINSESEATKFGGSGRRMKIKAY
jgi:hypothetical protein